MQTQTVSDYWLMNEVWLVNYSLHFRRVAGPKLLNKYMCYEVNFQKYDSFRRKF